VDIKFGLSPEGKNEDVRIFENGMVRECSTWGKYDHHINRIYIILQFNTAFIMLMQLKSN
jgi:hypothetical protein